jgi:transposase-like protein
MQYRKWDSKTKFQVVLEGLKGTANVTELCNRYQISQAQYYKWRDQFLANYSKTFDADSDKEKEQLKDKVKHLRNIIGSLTIELKKTMPNYKKEV